MEYFKNILNITNKRLFKNLTFKNRTIKNYWNVDTAGLWCVANELRQMQLRLITCQCSLASIFTHRIRS